MIFASLFGRFTFFFFQAEDGIRDLIVTGVQTCALPIFGLADERGALLHHDGVVGGGGGSEHAHLGGGGGQRRGEASLGPRGRAHVVVPQIGRASCRERV